MHRFVTFSSEIGYDECLHMETFQFGDDLVKIEPSQDKGCMPTSVTARPSRVRVDDPRIVQPALLSHTGPVQGVDPQAGGGADLLHNHHRQARSQGPSFLPRLWDGVRAVQEHRGRGKGLGLPERRSVRQSPHHGGIQAEAGQARV